MNHPIPPDALDDRLGFIGTSGSGKTYNAGGAVERLLEKRARVVIIDPLGVWWGLRLSADGKTASPFNVAIFGGPHGDLPLNEHAGALIGETAATMAESCIIDLRELGSKASERRFMVAFLETIYRKADGAPFHLVVDEADLFAPQKPQKGDEVLLGHMENIVRRGRVKGFIPWLISQRPAVLNKNVLSQVDGLVAFKLTSTQDRDALDAWIEGQADKARGKEIKASLAALQIGTGIVWLPGHAVLKTVQFPPKVTFDSSRTPKRGEKAAQTTALKPLDLGVLKERLAIVVAETKANDPRVLKAEVADLKKQVAQLSRKAEAGKPVDPDSLRAAEARGYLKGLKEAATAYERFGNQLASIQAAVSRAMNDADSGEERIKKQLQGSGLPSAVNSAVDTPKRASSSVTAVVRRPSPVPAGGDGAISGSERRIIDAIRWWNVFAIPTPSHAQVGFISGFSHKSGTWATYLSRLRSKGLIEGRGDLVLTDIGIATAAEPAAPPTVEALHAAVLEKIDAPLRKILQPLLEVYPDGLSHEEAGRLAGYSPSSGTWATYLSRLRSLDLISGRGELKAEAWLFAR